MRIRSEWSVVLFLVVFAATCGACGSKKSPPKAEKSPSQSTAAKREKTKEKTPSSESPRDSDEEAPRLSDVFAAGHFGAEVAAEEVLGRARLEGSDRQSVILIILDALNVKHLSAYGYRRPTSPNIEKLAKKGVRFVNYISNSSWTRPSFTTMITGLTKNEHKVELSSKILERDIETLAERFRGAGYATAGFVGNPLVREIWGFGQGFKTYKDTHGYDRVFPPDRWVARDAVEWLERNGDEPFFLMVFLTAAHTPYRPPASARRFLDEVPKGKVIEYPFREYKNGISKEDHERIVAAYDDEVAYADAQIGRILDHIEEGEKDDVAVVVTADHGEVFGLHNCYTHTYHMWEPALRVPLVIASKKLKEKGVTDTRLATHVDLVPTLTSLAGIEDDYDGSGVSVFAPHEEAEEGERLIFSQYNAHGIQREAIRRGRWKLVHHHPVKESALRRLNSLHRNIPHADPEDLPSISLGEERYELYDLREDPREQNDLYAESKAKPQEVKKLETELGLRIGEIEPEVPNLSEETLKALEAAGYISSGDPSKK